MLLPALSSVVGLALIDATHYDAVVGLRNYHYLHFPAVGGWHNYHHLRYIVVVYLDNYQRSDQEVTKLVQVRIGPTHLQWLHCLSWQ